MKPPAQKNMVVVGRKVWGWDEVQLRQSWDNVLSWHHCQKASSLEGARGCASLGICDLLSTHSTQVPPRGSPSLLKSLPGTQWLIPSLFSSTAVPMVPVWDQEPAHSRCLLTLPPSIAALMAQGTWPVLSPVKRALSSTPVLGRGWAPQR